ncbi:unnamed protein product [Calypogeia fissa]
MEDPTVSAAEPNGPLPGSTTPTGTRAESSNVQDSFRSATSRWGAHARSTSAPPYNYTSSYVEKATSGPDLEAPDLKNRNNRGGIESIEPPYKPYAGAKFSDAPPYWYFDHRSEKSEMLRAVVLGANAGLVTVSSIMLGVGAVKNNATVVSGLAGMLAGTCSMAIGEYASYYTQHDSEKASIEKERQQHAKGADAQAQELEQLAEIYVARGLPYYLAKQVAEELSKGDALRAHVRDDLGIDVESPSNPIQIAIASGLAFLFGSCVPLLAGSFITALKIRILVIVIMTSLFISAVGGIGSKLGGAPVGKGSLRGVIGGWLAMTLTYGIFRLLGTHGQF